LIIKLGVIVLNKKVLDTLKFLYKRNPLPFQTINFVGGAQQPLHSDTIHFSSIPQRWLGVSWIALEDVDEENGTLMYVPKSHKLPIFEFSNMGIEVPKYGEQFDAYSKYEHFIKQMVESKGLEIKTFTAKKGQALIWSANLLHGSVPIADENRTRYSQATHYYFDGCSKYYSPMFSDTLRGNVSEKDLTEKDIINHEIKL
jgi:ectoine hydroxylase-related dioxygenase (phytanoyl-CoA dioxygenase family)